MKKLRPVLAMSAFTLASAGGSAFAMAAPPCLPAAVTPSPATSIIVPANIPGFGYTAVKAVEKDVRLFSTSGAQVELGVNIGPVEGQYTKISPKTPLVPGTSYRLEYEPFCSFNPTPVKPIAFVAGPEAPLPTKLADLVGAPTVTTKDFGTTQYTIAAAFAVAPEMKPWLDVYQVAIAVDGKLVSTSRVPGANDSFTAMAVGWCDATNAATTKHTVQLRARLPFAPSVESASTDLDFDCPAPRFTTSPPYTDPVGGTSGGGTSSPTTSSSGGCAIALDARSSSPFALGAIALGLAAISARRRRAGQHGVRFTEAEEGRSVAKRRSTAR